MGRRAAGHRHLLHLPDGRREASVAANQAAGVEVTWEPQTYPWGTEAMFAAPFGNEFAVFEYAGE